MTPDRTVVPEGAIDASVRAEHGIDADWQWAALKNEAPELVERWSVPVRAVLSAALASGALVPAEERDHLLFLLREARAYVSAHEPDPQHLTVAIDEARGDRAGAKGVVLAEEHDPRWPAHEWANVSGALMDTGDLAGDLTPSEAIRQLTGQRDEAIELLRKARAWADLFDTRREPARYVERHRRDASEVDAFLASRVEPPKETRDV